MKILPDNNLKYREHINNQSGAKDVSRYQRTRTKTGLRASEIPLDSLKANYCLSFGKYKKAGDVILIDKDTEKPVIATLRKEKTGDFVSYKIFAGREEAGFMDMNREAIFPEGDYVLTEPDNVLPKVAHLRSLLGDKYSGIGTSLINAAIQESCMAGKNGSLWLNAERGYARGYSPYRSDENPIPFYYKLGFKAVDPSIDKLIETCIENSDYKNLPDSALLLLTSDAINAKNKYFSQNYRRA